MIYKTFSAHVVVVVVIKSARVDDFEAGAVGSSSSFHCASCVPHECLPWVERLGGH